MREETMSRDKLKIVALLTKSGTACSETALSGDEDTPEARERIENQFCTGHWDAPVKATWTDVSDNDAFWTGETYNG